MVNESVTNALKYWEKGHNCARSVACGVLTAYNLESEAMMLNKALVPFGGGVGEGQICGAVTGGLISTSLLLGKEKKKEEEIKEASKVFKDQFKNHFGTIVCAQLLAEFKTKEGSINYDNEERRKKCTMIVKTAARVAQKAIESI